MSIYALQIFKKILGKSDIMDDQYRARQAMNNHKALSLAVEDKKEEEFIQAFGNLAKTVEDKKDEDCP
jgi:hypothetical protein